MNPTSPVIFVEVPGRPVPWARAGSQGNRRYTPSRVRAAAESLQAEMKVQCRSPLTGPLDLAITFCYRRPDSWNKAKREAIDNGEEPWFSGRPDIDNLCKLVMEAGTGILWEDDAQVVSLEAVKVYGAENLTVLNLSCAWRVNENISQGQSDL